MSDLVGGRYPQAWSINALLGGLTNVAQSNVPARSNLEWFGLSTTTDSAIAATGVAQVVAVPVDVGQTISAISVLVGGTAASVPTHQFAALYTTASTPALIGQSTDTTTAAVAASAHTTWTLTTPYNVTAAACGAATTGAEGGFLYVAFSLTSTTQPTAISVAVPTATQYAYFTGSPAALSATSGTSLAGTAAATLTLAKAATAPVVILT